MKILWMTWKDLANPLAGGAEVVNEQLARRLVADGHEVTLLTAGFKGGGADLIHQDGYRIIRVGSRPTVYWYAYRYYKKHLQGWPDMVIDEVNTMPFFAKWYVQEPHIMFAHMLCRKIWFYEMPQPLSSIGYLAELLYMRLLSNQTVITVSSSTKQDLMRVGFQPDRIHIISEGLNEPGAPNLPAASTKAPQPTMLSLGAMRSMKRTLDQVKAFELAKPQLSELKLSVVGDSSGKYGQRVLKAIDNSPYKADITYHGRVAAADKVRLMRESHVIAVTSVKEGWGLIVTEANSQGTPAVVYDVDGLRDSVRSGQTGLVTAAETPQALADSTVKLLTDQPHYEKLRHAAYDWSQTITFDQSYQDFKQVLAINTPRNSAT